MATSRLIFWISFHRPNSFYPHLITNSLPPPLNQNRLPKIFKRSNCFPANSSEKRHPKKIIHPFIFPPCGVSFRFPVSHEGFRKLLPYNPSDTPLARWAKNLHYTPQRSCRPRKNAGKNIKNTWKVVTYTALFLFIHFALCIGKKSCHSKNWRSDFWVFGSCPVFSFSKENFPTHEFTAHLSHLRRFFDQFAKKNRQNKWPGRGHQTYFPRYKDRPFIGKYFKAQSLSIDINHPITKLPL